MNQSTIYERHARRRAKTQALSDDPRPALVRVASGLPLLNLVFFPYQPNENQATDATPTIPTETIYSGFSSKVCSSQPLDVTKIVFAAALAGGLAHAFVGTSHNLPRPRGSVVSLFQGAPTLNGQGALAFTNHARARYITSITRVSIPGRTMPIAIGASTASLFFGARALIVNAIGDRSDSLGLMLSSGAAGALVGIFNALTQSLPSQRHAMGTSLDVVSFFRSRLCGHALGQHALGGMLYLSTYDALNSISTKSEEPSYLATCLSGAMAGAVYRGVTSGGMIPAMVRAMPHHAIFFLGYETLLKCTHSQ